MSRGSPTACACAPLPLVAAFAPTAELPARAVYRTVADDLRLTAGQRGRRLAHCTREALPQTARPRQLLVGAARLVLLVDAVLLVLTWFPWSAPRNCEGPEAEDVALLEAESNGPRSPGAGPCSFR